MYAYNIRFLERANSVTFKLAEGQKFYELNGRLFTPTMVSETNGTVSVTHQFNTGDVFGAYVVLPIIQPDNFNRNERDSIISKIYACMKQVQLSPFTTVASSEYFLTPTDVVRYNNIALANVGKFVVLGDQQPVVGYRFEAGQNYEILYGGNENEASLQLIEGDPVTVSEVTNKSVKGEGYQIFSFTPRSSFRCTGVYLVNSYIHSVEGLDIPTSNNLTYDVEETSLPVANPRFQFSTSNGLTSDSSYLVEVGSAAPKEYVGQLPSFVIPAALTTAFTVNVYTRKAWNRGNIKPVPAEFSGFLHSQNEWTVTVTEEANYVKTEFKINAIEFSRDQTYLWEDLSDN